MMMLVHTFLSDTAARCADKPAIVCRDRIATFGDVDRGSDSVACGLQALGIRRGDRVALLMDNSIEMVIALFGALKAGAVFVPLNPTMKADKIAYVVDDCQVRCIIAAGHLAATAHAAIAERPYVALVLPDDVEDWLAQPHSAPADPGLIDNDLCTIIYTSGSTGRPKGVMLTHRNMHNTAWSISSYIGNRADDVVMCVLPLSFDYGLYQVITGARVGFTLVLEPSFAFPFEVLKQMVRWKVTGLPGVPTIFAVILQMAPDLDLSSVRYLTNTAAALPPAHIRRLGQVFPNARIFSMYGLTECTRVCYLDPDRLDDKITSVGKAIPNSEVYVVGDDGRRLPPGEVGELVIRGANVMRGYWGKPEETAERLRDGEILGEKVLYSGDLFSMDEEGFLYFVGRKDDIFKCRGEKVSPKEIEHVLYELDDIAEAAVIGVDDPIDGTAIKAVIAIRPGSSLGEAEVRRHCRARLEIHLVPKFIELIAELPKTETGKIRRKSLTA